MINTKSYLERNVSLHRSGYLYHKIIPSRKNQKLPAVVSHHHLSGLVHCPQPETCVSLPFVKLHQRLHDLIDVPFEDGFCSNQELHKHVSWDTMHPAYKSPNCTQSRLDLLEEFWSASPSTIAALDRAFCLCYPFGSPLKTLLKFVCTPADLGCPLERQVASCPCQPCRHCLH